MEDLGQANATVGLYVDIHTHTHTSADAIVGFEVTETRLVENSTFIELTVAVLLQPIEGSLELGYRILPGTAMGQYLMQLHAQACATCRCISELF